MAVNVSSLLLFLSLLNFSFANNCTITKYVVTCQINVDNNGLDDADKLKLNKPITLKLFGRKTGQYLVNYPEYFDSLKVENLTIGTNESNEVFHQRIFCIFSQHLKRLEFMRAQRFLNFRTNRGNFIKLPNLSCLKNLEELAFQDNKIKAIRRHTLKGLKSLVTLDAFNNDIVFIDSKAFTEYTPKLQEVMLMQNKIYFLHPDTFKNHPSLQEINLSSNNLENIDDIFTSVLQLKSLSLDYNMLKRVSTETFTSGLPKIEYISITNNEIETIDDFSFHNLISLEELILDHNRITTIKRDTLKGLEKLKKALFGYNDISYIEDYSFSGMPNLQYVELWDNSLNTLKRETFVGVWDNLKLLDVGANDFVCDCNLKWVVEAYQGKNETQMKNLPSLIMGCRTNNTKPISVDKATLKDINCD